jgi:replicative DNA helicase
VSAHGLIYTTILDLYARGQGHDQIAVAAELAKQEQLEQAGGSDYLQAVASGIHRHVGRESPRRSAERSGSAGPESR